MRRVAIIGSGIAGIAVAIRLARMSFIVDVFEKASTPGGKVAEFQQQGFRFDMGPSLFTLPELVDELLDEEYQFSYDKLETITRYFYEDGTQINAFADIEKFAQELNSKVSIPRKRLLKHINKAAFIYRNTAPVFLFSSIHRIKDLWTFGNLKRLFALPGINALKSMHKTNEKVIGEEHLVQLFDRYATYNGSNPYRAPGTLNVISHLEHALGAYFPQNGMRTIINSLYEQAKKLGVKFHFNEEVCSVVSKKKHVKGVGTKGGFYSSNMVISDVDIYHFYSRLLPDSKKLRKLKKEERSTSALIFYWGVKRQFPELDLHNIFFSQNYREEFDFLFNKKQLSDDPTVYLFISSKQNESDAPSGCENWFVMVNAPENIGQDWSQLIEKTRQVVISKLNRMLGENIEQHILFEQILDPLQIEERTGSYHGALYGPSSNSRFSAFNRHPNFHRTIGGLYFVGGSVHPGGGIPLCLSSAKIVARIIQDKED
ncbi:1-hydroxycarotenoid 3,4-desaturase CrtD [Sunxiuqinia sp. A32]|uniref:1-hydroxycarotenoid 3,4-desaturase CrtD n=1 Tax=Sunxiuqinia sp. A32 TaxID=3461496 RepID=UPI0040457571